MRKKQILGIFFGIGLSLFFYFYIFQHPVFISKKALLISAALGFGISFLLYILSGKSTESSFDRKLIRWVILLSLVCTFFILFFFDTPTNFLLAPRIDLEISLPPQQDSSTTLTSLNVGLNDVSLKGDVVLLQTNADKSATGITMHATKDEGALISWNGRMWDQVSLIFSDSSPNTEINIRVNENDNSINVGQGSEEQETSTFIPMPNESLLNILSHLSVAIAVFTSLAAGTLLLSTVFHDKEESAVINVLIACVLLLIFLFSLLYFFPQSPNLRYPNIDSSTYMYLGRGLLQGKIPYRDIWDNKGPLLYFINAVGQIIGPWGTWLIQVLFAIASCFIFAHILKQNKKSVVVIIISLLLYLSTFTRWLKGGNFTEQYATPFYLLGLELWYLILNTKEKKKQNRYAFLIGALLACCILLRPNLISPFLTIGIFLLFLIFTDRSKQFSFKILLFLILGFLVVFLCFAVYFGINNAFGDFIDAVFYYNFFYTENTSDSILRNVQFIFERNPNFSRLAILFVILHIYRQVELKEKITKSTTSLFTSTIILGFLIELILYNMSGRSFNHYCLSVYPYLFLIIALGIRDSTSNHLSVTRSFSIVFCILLLSLGTSMFVDELRKPHIEKSSVFSEAVSLLHNDQKLEVWGYRVDFHYEANAEPSSKFIYHHPLMVCNYVDKEMINSFVDSISEYNPLIIDSLHDTSEYSLNAEMRSDDSCPELAFFYNFVDQNYSIHAYLSNGYPVYAPDKN